MATWNTYLFQDSLSPTMETLISFHDYTMTIMTVVITLVFTSLTLSILSKKKSKTIYTDHLTELLWTLFPLICIMLILYPALEALYIMESDDSTPATLSVKTIGNQWYWTYEYGILNISFDSYMTPYETSFLPFQFLEVDNPLVLPYSSKTRLLISSSDVIHSWTIPALAIKMDAIPGRLNSTTINPTRPGIFYGQCSEICGAFHSFMPIKLELISTKEFINWVNKQL